jgi:hypothetical protein
MRSSRHAASPKLAAAEVHHPADTPSGVRRPDGVYPFGRQELPDRESATLMVG